MGWLFGNGVKTSWLDVRLGRLKQKVGDDKLIESLRAYCLKAPLAELANINLLTIEREWNVSRQKLVPLFLHASKLNIFTMHYVMHCEGCKGQGSAPNLETFRKEMVCAGCNYANSPKLDASIEIAFSIHPDLAKVGKNKPEGHFISAIEVINTDEFRLLFEEEKPLPGEHVIINSLTFFFTDLSGSTATYERLGDGSAYKIVREHFTLLFDSIKRHNGTVVKTIGDAVMATFLSPADAIEAALDARKAFKTFNKRKDIKGAAGIKIGVHSGNCLAVTLNSRLDFFGSTVNKAARIQGAAEKDEICVSKDTFEDAKSRKLFSGLKTKGREVVLKGIEKPVEILSLAS